MNSLLSKLGVVFSLCCQGLMLLSGLLFMANPRSVNGGALLMLVLIGYPIGAVVLGWNYCERRGAGAGGWL
jgi:hypothetical protein